MKPEVLPPFTMQDPSNWASSANWNMIFDQLFSPYWFYAKPIRIEGRTISCCGVSGCSGKQFKITKLPKNRLVKTMMDKIHGFILLTVKVTWHGRIISPSFSACICQITQGRLHCLNVGVYTEQVVLRSPYRQERAGEGRQWILGCCLS